MATFAENRIQVLADYVPDDLNTLMQDVREALADADITVRGAITGPDASRVQQVLSARRAIHAFLSNPSTASARRQLRTIATHFANHRFDSAEDVLDDLADLPAVRRVTSFGDAFRRTPLNFREQFASDPDQPGPVFSVPRTLPGYGGKVPNSTERTQLLAWSSFVSRDNERRFRIGVLRAEAAAGRRRFVGAVTEYQKLLDSPAGFSTAQLKFVALRIGQTHVAAGDARFRSARRLNTLDRFVALASYRNAIQAVTRQQVSARNPLHTQIVDHAQNRIAQLEAGINFLGLRDSFVPVHRHQFLLQLTTTAVTAANDALEKFARYQTKADDLAAAERETRFQLEVARVGVDTAAARHDIAAAQADRVDIQIQELSRQQGLFTVENFASAFEFAARMAASPESASGFAMAAGAAGMVTGHMARQNELDFQMDLAGVDRTIADLETQIADSEIAIANRRVEFLQEMLDIGPGRFTKDVYYQLSRFYEQLAERMVEAGIRYAYLYERALAFFLGKPGIQHIALDYRAADGDLLTAADRLDGAVQRVTAELLRIGPEDVRRPFTEPPFSLAREFPVEFARFVQTPAGETARMGFVVSFHQLSKRRPDCHQVRIARVTVRIPSLGSGANFAGTLTHWGRFLVRDRTATLFDPEAVRLIPTPEQVEQALRVQREKGTTAAAIGGVVPYALAPQPVPFGAPSEVTSQFVEFTLGAFEGYGPAGAWELELRNVNMRDISDVTLTFDLEAAADATQLETKIEPLVAAYEQELADRFVDGETLDRVRVLSLRRRFPDALEDLRTGTGTVTLAADDFDDADFDGTNARVRTVLMQAVDADAEGLAGIGLEVTKPGTTFALARTTGAGGFSDDLGAGRPPIQPPENRPSGAGTWRLRLPDPAQAQALDDLVLFFICDFR